MRMWFPTGVSYTRIVRGTADFHNNSRINIIIKLSVGSNSTSCSPSPEGASQVFLQRCVF